MFTKLLIANRGEIACRVIGSARRLGIRTVAVYSDADVDAAHVRLADEAYRLGPAEAAESYLHVERLLSVAAAAGADSVHPGYGFLSENPQFVDACEDAGLCFVGPPAAAIRAMGLKDAAKSLMERHGVPVVPGYHGGRQDEVFLAERAAEIGYPVLLKACAGGGGKGMRRVDRADEFVVALAAARREAAASFGDQRMLIEKYIQRPRHIEMQVFADRHDTVLHLFERDCSLQRRHQKVIEEAPAPGMSPELRAVMGEAAVRAARAVAYRGAGTVEFIADAAEGLREDRFYFMEMNTRLQVEHPVTEMITGLDLVEWQLRVAAGQALPEPPSEPQGHAVEARLYAEDPAQGFLPATGTLRRLRFPPQVRVDSGVRRGDRVTPHYDPLLAKMIAHGPDRPSAWRRLAVALEQTRIGGCRNNVGFLARLARHPQTLAGEVDTGLIGRELTLLNGPAAPPAEAVALATLYLAGGFAEPDAPADPWRGLRGWRHWEAAGATFRLEHQDRVYECSLSGADGAYRLICGETVLSASALLLERGAEGATLRASLDGRRYSAGLEDDGDNGVSLYLGAETYRFAIEQPGGGGGPARAGVDADHRLLAPMPGLVRAVHVAAGDRVETGQPLVIMEAMKMELSLTAPRDGVVGEVAAAAGDQVDQGFVLITLDGDRDA